MRAVWTERIAIAALAVLIIGGLVWFAWPQPTPVDLAPVTRGSMEVTVDDDAKTHVRHIYTIYAPIAGTVLSRLRAECLELVSRFIKRERE